MASDRALQDFVTLTEAVGQFAGSVASLFNAKVESEAQRINIINSNRRTDFLMRFTLPRTDPNYIGTDNYADKLREFTDSQSAQFETIIDPAVKNKVESAFVEGENQFRLQIAQQMSAAAMRETQENKYIVAKAIESSALDWASKEKKYLEHYEEVKNGKYFSPADFAVKFDPILANIQGRRIADEVLAASDDPRGEAVKLSLDEKAGTMEARAVAKQAIIAAADAMDAQAKERFENEVKPEINLGLLTVEAAEQRIAGLGGTRDFVKSMNPTLRTMVDDAAQNMMKKIVMGYESNYPAGIVDRDTYDVAVGLVNDVMPSLGVNSSKANDERQQQIEKLNVLFNKGQDPNSSERNKNIEDFYKWLAKKWRLVNDTREISAVDVANEINIEWMEKDGVSEIGYKTLREIADGKFTADEGARKLATTLLDDGFRKAVLGGMQARGEKVNKTLADALSQGSKASGKAAYIQQVLMANIGDRLANSLRSGTSVPTEELINKGIRLAIAINEALGAMDFKLKPGEGDIMDKARQLHAFQQTGDSGDLAEIFATSRGNQSMGDFGLSAALRGLDDIIVYLFDRAAKESKLPDGIKNINQTRAILATSGERYLVSADGKHCFGLDAVGKKGSGQYNLVYYSFEGGAPVGKKTVISFEAPEKKPSRSAAMKENVLEVMKDYGYQQSR